MTTETAETTDPKTLDTDLADIQDLLLFKTISQVIQALSYIAGYSTYRHLNRMQAYALCHQSGPNLLLDEFERNTFRAHSYLL